MKKLLIVSAAAGSGHTRAAEALEIWAKQLYCGKNIAVQKIEFSDYLTRPTRAIFFAAYERLIYKIPELWRFVYEATNHTEVSDLILRTAQLFQTIDARRYARAVTKLAPDYILSTHFVPPLVGIPELTRRQEIRTGVVVTDYTPHALWMSGPEHDYFVPTKAAGEALVARGVPENQITVSGIPVEPHFYEQDRKSKILNPTFAKATAGKQKSKITNIVLMAGGNAMIPLDEIAQAILNIPETSVTVITGKNKKLFETVKKLTDTYPGRLKVFSWVGKEFPDLLRQADVVVSKPGGLTLTECLVLKKTFIVINPIPGQETGNAKIFAEHGGLVANGEQELISLIKKLQKSPAPTCTGLLPSEPAAKIILERVLKLMKQ